MTLLRYRNENPGAEQTSERERQKGHGVHLMLRKPIDAMRGTKEEELRQR